MNNDIAEFDHCIREMMQGVAKRMRMNIAIVPAFQVDAIWPRLAKGFQHACKRCGDATAGHLWQECRSGHAFLIIAYEGQPILMASVWRFENKGEMPVFRCNMMYGSDMRKWLNEAEVLITRIAKENGAKALVADGRRGWLRIFKKAVENGADIEVKI